MSPTSYLAAPHRDIHSSYDLIIISYKGVSVKRNEVIFLF